MPCTSLNSITNQKYTDFLNRIHNLRITQILSYFFNKFRIKNVKKICYIHIPAGIYTIYGITCTITLMQLNMRLGRVANNTCSLGYVIIT